MAHDRVKDLKNKMLQNRGLLSSSSDGSTANFGGINSLILYIPDFLSIFLEMSNVYRI